MLSNCHRCGKRVFFAEKETSLGRDWHRQCLVCASCTKVLNPGQHVEYEGTPCCEGSCYDSIYKNLTTKQPDNKRGIIQRFEDRNTDLAIVNNNNNNQVNISMSSPRMDGRAPKISEEERADLAKKLKIHNDAHPDSFVTLIEKDGHVTLEGSLRLHWGVNISIRFKRDDTNESTPFTKRIGFEGRRVGKTKSFHSHNDLIQNEPPKDPFRTLKSEGVPEVSSQQMLAVKMKRGQFHTVRESKVKRRCSINGHYYKTETSENFVPAFGSVTKVFIGSFHKTTEVIKRLLDKFKIENDASCFALYLVKPNGEMWPLSDSQHPLMERLNLLDPSARIFLMDKPYKQLVEQTVDNTTPNNNTAKNIRLTVWKPVEEEAIPQEVASYITLPDPMLHAFINMFDKEEEVAKQAILEKYEKIKTTIQELMIKKNFSQETYL